MGSRSRVSDFPLGCYATNVVNVFANLQHTCFLLPTPFFPHAFLLVLVFSFHLCEIQFVAQSSSRI